MSVKFGVFYLKTDDICARAKMPQIFRRRNEVLFRLYIYPWPENNEEKIAFCFMFVSIKTAV
jgi:hypothetical protein